LPSPKTAASGLPEPRPVVPLLEEDTCGEWSCDESTGSADPLARISNASSHPWVSSLRREAKTPPCLHPPFATRAFITKRPIGTIAPIRPPKQTQNPYNRQGQFSRPRLTIGRKPTSRPRTGRCDAGLRHAQRPAVFKPGAARNRATTRPSVRLQTITSPLYPAAATRSPFREAATE